jgi:hypothetical protein
MKTVFNSNIQIVALAIGLLACSCSKSGTNYGNASSNNSLSVIPSNVTTSKLALLQNKSWRLTEVWSNNQNIIQSCQMDNIEIFRSSGRYDLQLNSLCDNESNVNESYIWTLTDHASQISIQDSNGKLLFEYTVAKIEGSTIVLISPNGNKHVYTLK